MNTIDRKVGDQEIQSYYEIMHLSATGEKFLVNVLIGSRCYTADIHIENYFLLDGKSADEIEDKIKDKQEEMLNLVEEKINENKS